MRFFKSDRGFTLIEMVGAIAILAIILSVVLFNMQAAKEKARSTQRASDYANIEVALRLYKDVHGEYPNTIVDGTVTWWTACTNNTGGVGSKELSGPDGYIPGLAPEFIATLPTEPSGCAGGVVKGYIYRSDGVDYKFASDWLFDAGPDCEPGGRFADTFRPSPILDAETGKDIYFCSISTPGFDLH